MPSLAGTSSSSATPTAPANGQSPSSKPSATTSPSSRPPRNTRGFSFQGPTARSRRSGDVPTPRAKGDLRTYVDLVDNNDRGRTRLDWETELAELRARGARYGDMLVRSADPVAMLERWNGWIEACEALT